MAAKAKSKRSPVTVRGSWFPMPVAFLRSRACAELSPHALKLLMDLCSQLGPNARGNGDLEASFGTLAIRGWTSNATRNAALAELLDRKLLAATRRGDRRRCALYAVTLWPMDCDFSKLDHGPGCYSTSDWEAAADRAAEPSESAPAAWASPRKNAISRPATGRPPRVMNPPRADLEPRATSYRPATGSQPLKTGNEVGPPRATFLDDQSEGPVSSSPARLVLAAVGGRTT